MHRCTGAFGRNVFDLFAIRIDAGYLGRQEADTILVERFDDVHEHALGGVMVGEDLGRDVWHEQQAGFFVDNRDIDAITGILADFLCAAQAGKVAAQYNHMRFVKRGIHDVLLFRFD